AVHSSSTLRVRATPPPAMYTLSLHDALPILRGMEHSLHPSVLASRKDLARLLQDDNTTPLLHGWRRSLIGTELQAILDGKRTLRSEEHTSELQSRENLVCRLLLEKKKSGTIY